VEFQHIFCEPRVADIAYSEDEAHDLFSTSFAIELVPLPGKEEFVLVTLIRIKWKAVSTVDVELVITRNDICKRKIYREM
jgi:hypothetical protein